MNAKLAFQRNFAGQTLGGIGVDCGQDRSHIETRSNRHRNPIPTAMEMVNGGD